eukprot:6969067-Pyramimonas_sp.AAC.1
MAPPACRPRNITHRLTSGPGATWCRLVPPGATWCHLVPPGTTSSVPTIITTTINQQSSHPNGPPQDRIRRCVLTLTDTCQSAIGQLTPMDPFQA